MVTQCCSYNCGETAKKGKLVSFHTFPKDEQIRQQWIKAMNRPNFTPKNGTRLCGKHFRPDDYTGCSKNNRTLKKDAVPSIFTFVKPEIKLQRHIPTIPEFVDVQQIKTEIVEDDSVTLVQQDNQETANISVGSFIIVQQDNEETTNITDDASFTQINEETTNMQPSKSNTRIFKKSLPRFFGEYEINDLKTEEARRLFFIAYKQINKYKRTIKALRTKERRFRNKCKTLEDALDNLLEKSKIPNECFKILEDRMTPTQKQLFLRESKFSTDREYPEELRTFAVTLNSHSVSAYEYVRNFFSNSLPHPKTLQKWCTSVKRSPGFTDESLKRSNSSDSE